MDKGYTGNFLVAQAVKNLPASAGDPGLIPGSGGSPGEGTGNPLQNSRLGNPMDRGAWRATIHGVARVRHDLAIKQQNGIQSHTLKPDLFNPEPLLRALFSATNYQALHEEMLLLAHLSW